MFIARVLGTTWATRKHPALAPCKLLLVRQYDVFEKKYSGKIMMAVDCSIDAGIGDTVLILDEGGSARQIMNSKDAPVRTIVAGIVDEVKSGDRICKCH